MLFICYANQQFMINNEYMIERVLCYFAIMFISAYIQFDKFEHVHV